MISRKEYGMQRAAARQRGIDFLLTYEEWFTWWLQTGCAGARGRGKNSFVMARLGDQGPYRLGNIECKRFTDNVREARQRDWSETRRQQ